MFTKCALVDYVPAASLPIVYSLAVATGKDAGVSQQDAVQLVTELQAYRAALAHPGVMRVAQIDTRNRVSKIRYLSKLELPEGAATVFPIVGDEPYSSNPDARRVMLAIDDVLRSIKDAPTGGVAMGPAFGPAGPALAVIVTGVAVTVAATTAIWRYFNPELRARLAAIAASAAAYKARLEAFASTGVMPPPSEMEKSMPEVTAAAKDESKWAWGLGLGAAVGIPVAVVGVSAFNRALSPR